jgi:hypothetical protein
MSEWLQTLDRLRISAKLQSESNDSPDFGIGVLEAIKQCRREWSACQPAEYAREIRHVSAALLL